MGDTFIDVDQQIAEIAERIRRLRDADPHYRVFGSEKHRYRLGPTLLEADLSVFEILHGLRLPEDYRLFLKRIGDGGTGPKYGMETLATASHGNLQRPFPFTVSTEDSPAEIGRTWYDADDDGGILEFCHYGCAIFAYLVVNGPTRGTVWEGREDLSPTGMPFAGWYRAWADLSLIRLENERLLRRLRLRAGITLSQVMDATGVTWNIRQVRNWRNGKPLRLAEAPDMPAQLVVDDRENVIEIRPWPFL